MLKWQNGLYCSSKHNNKLVRNQHFWTTHMKIENRDLEKYIGKWWPFLENKYTAIITLCSDQATSGAHSNGAVASNYASGTSHVTGETESI